ncbi:phosphoribosyl-ATP diphosphatase, partial [Staphylococcus aureus]
TVQDSAQSNNEKSYTKYLLTEGIEKITKKYGEEAFEVVIEAIKGDKKAFVSEVADELYHLFVLMHALGVDFSEIEAELARRHHKRNNFKGERQNIEQW